MKKSKSVLTKSLAFILSLCLVIPGSLPSISANEDNSNSVGSDYSSEINISWYDDGNVNGNSYTLTENLDTTNSVKMRVSYRNEEIREEGYQPGDLVISIKGIGNVLRSEVIEAKVGADKASEGTSNRDWSYTWNKYSDTYILVNNEEIEPNSVFSGYFELVWEIPSRESKHGYENSSIVAELMYPDGEAVKSNYLSFSNKTKCDTYEIDIEKQEMYSYEGLVSGISSPDDYVFIRYNLSSDSKTNSRGVKNDKETYIFNPDVDGVGKGYILVSPKLLNYARDDGTYQIILEKNTNEEQYLFVAYPKDKYLGTTIKSSIESLGVYHEGNDDGVTGQVSLAKDVVECIIPSDFDFIDIPGVIYQFWKESYYDRHVSQSTIDERGGDIVGRKMEEGTTETFYLEGELNVSPGNSYTLDIVEDFLYILQNDGNYRQLKSGEYNFKSVEIPSVSNLINLNGVSISSNKYKVNIYAVSDDKNITYSENEIVYSGLLTNSSKKVTLPDDTTSFSVKIEDLSESVKKYSIPVEVNFHLNEEDKEEGSKANLLTGQVINTSFIRLYDKDGNWINEFSKDEYVTDDINIDLADKDLKTYGGYLDREKDNITFYQGNKSDYSANVNIGDFEYSGNKYISDFSMGASFRFTEEDIPNKFSLYTVLPEGLKIKGYLMEEDIWDIMELSGFNLSSDVLSNCCSVEIIENYKDSGRVYISLHFDLTGYEVPQVSYITAKMQVEVSKKFFKDVNTTVNVRSAVLVDKDISEYDVYKSLDDGKWDLDSSVSEDIDRDGNKDELLEYAHDWTSYVFVDSSQFSLSKSVTTIYSDGYVQLPEIPHSRYGSAYSYELSLRNGSNESKNIVIKDCLETGSNSQWKGTFSSIDISEAENIGMKCTVWYSDKENPGEVGGSDWYNSLSSSKVKSVAVDFGDSVLGSGEEINIVINMVSPEDTSLKNKVTENNFSVSLTMSDLSTGNTTKHDDLSSNYVQVKLTSELKNIVITKIDSKDSKKLSGAVFSLINNSTGEVFGESTTNEQGYAIFKGVPSDTTYTIREKTAPGGYKVSEDVNVTFGDDSTFRVTIVDDRKTGSVQIHKRNNLNSKVDVPDTEFTVYDINGNEVKKGTTDINGDLTISGLEWGNYTVKETKASEGYILNDKVYDVSITKDNVDVVKNIVVVNEQEDTSLKVTKYEETVSGVQTTNTIKGTIFRLTYTNKGQNIVIGDYITDDNGMFYIEDLPYGTYLLREVRAAQGYLLAEDISFTIEPSNKDLDLSVYNKRKSGIISIYKKDSVGNQVEGVVFELFDNTKNNVLGTYTTDYSGNILIQNLEWGTYYLKEKSTLECYILDTEWKEVVIGRNSLNVSLNLINETKKGSIVLTKTDEVGNVRLKGAEFALYNSDGSLLQEGLVTGEDGILRVDDLEWGSYYFKETKAPDGYGMTDETIRFSVNSLNAGVEQSLVVENPNDSRMIKLTKTISTEDINFANGDPTFIFLIKNKSDSSSYYRIVRFTEEYVMANTDGYGFVSQSVTVSGVPSGEYRVCEDVTSRYSLSKITDISSNVSIVDNTYADIDLSTEKEGSVTFINNKYENSNFSDNQSISNILKVGKKLTAIKVRWLGDYSVTARSEIDRSLVKVTAFYDDGSYKILSDTDWSFGESYNGVRFPTIKGVYNIPITYTEGGITKNSSFEVSVDVSGVLYIVSLEASVKDEYNTIDINTTLNEDMFNVVAVYNDNSRDNLSNYSNHYSISPESAPSTEGMFDVSISLNSSIYEEVISTSINMYAVYPEPILMKGSDFNKQIEGYKIVFTDDVAPEDVSVVDVSEVGNESVVSWVSDSVMYVSSQRENVHVIANEDSSHMFDSSEFSEFDFTALDTSRVIDMSYMFSTCLDASTLDLSDFDTSNVEDMSYMFYNSWNTTSYNLSSFETTKVTDMRGMFKDSSSSLTSLDLSSFDTTNVENMAEMFYNCKGLTSLDVTGFNTSNVENMSNMFYYCKGLTSLDLSKFVTNEVSDFSGMFYYCYGLSSLDLSNFNTSKATTMKEMFYRCSSLSNLNISSFNTSKVEDMTSMFTNCAFTSVDVTNFDTSNVKYMTSMFSLCSKLLSVNVSKFATNNVEDMSYMFSNCYNLGSLDITNFDTSKVVNMAGMFLSCYNITELDLSNFNTSKVQYMNNMFDECSGLLYLDLSSFNTEKVTTMAEMFRDADSLTGVNLSSFKTPLLTDIKYLFNGCSSLLEIDLNSLDTSKCTDFSSIFGYCSGLKSLDLSGLETDSCTTFYYMFDGCTGLTVLDLSTFNTESLTSTSFMFRDCSNLMKVTFGDWNTENWVNAWSMFKNCSSLTEIDLGNLETYNLTNVKDMFVGCDAATVGYAISDSAAELFNGSSNKPDSLIFNSVSKKIELTVDNRCSDLVEVDVPEVVEAGITRLVVKPLSDNKVVDTFKLNGVLVDGDTFTALDDSGTVVISDVVLLDCVIIETNHNPYDNATNNTNSDGTVGTSYGEVRFEGAKSLTVTLTYQTESIYYDWIYLYDENNNIINDKYGGTTLKTEDIVVEGDYVKIMFITDSYGNSYYGFKAVIVPNY